MIHLDTNYLIGLAVPGSLPAQKVDKWLADGERLAASALVWTEFLNGPVTAQEIVLVESVIEPKLVPFEKRTELWPPNSLIEPVAAAVHALIV